MVLKVEKNTYPSGGTYFSVFNDDTRIGNYDQVDGGFLPQGCRKVLVDERDAQFKVVQRYIAHHIGLAAKAAQLYEEM